MNFTKKVILLLKKNNISKKILLDLELGKNSMVDWEIRGNIPSGVIVAKIAKYFNISTDYLLGITDFLFQLQLHISVKKHQECLMFFKNIFNFTHINSKLN